MSGVLKNGSFKKKIVIVGPAYPYRGGPALFVGNLYEQLVKDFNVEVFSFTRLYPQLLFPGVRQEDVSKVPAKPHPVHRTIDSINPLTWYKTAREILLLKPDLVAFDWYQPFFGMAYNTIAGILKKAGIKVLFITENVISHEARFIDTFLTKIALRHADAFLTLSDSVRDFLKSMFGGKPIWQSTLPLFHTSENAAQTWTADSAKEKLALKNKNVILFFGYIRKYKGLRDLIAAFPAVLKSVPDAHLLIVGESYENVEEYHALIKQSGAESSITMINEYVPNEEIPLYYTAADVVALPYISATQSGIVKIAFGFEKPVVATDVGGLAEEVLKTGAGIVVPPHDVEKFAQALIDFFKNSDIEAFKKGAREAKESNDFSKISGIFSEILGKI
jgi:glycosyltransferase involved in cell wall biosynthesis